MSTLDIATNLDDLKIVTLTDGEVWSARDLMPFAGYERWENWSKAINRAIASVNASGLDASNHFRGVAKMVELGSGSRRQVEDLELTRYACYILFQNADGSKPEIAALQQYFAVQTRKQEIAAAPALSDDEIVARALRITSDRVHALEAKVAEDAPKVAYVDEFVSPDDVILFKVASAQLGLSEPQLRERLLDAGWVYRKQIGTRWSQSQARHVDEFEWRAYANHADKFSLKPQHNAPRHHNGQVKQTLYIHAAAMPAFKLRFGQLEVAS